MTDREDLPLGQRAIGDFLPKLATLTDEVLFGDIWERPGLSQRERSLITLASLITLGDTAALPHHFERAQINGLDQDELKEVIVHLAFYAGWPRAVSALNLAKVAFADD